MRSAENLCKARECERCCWNVFLGMSSENFRLFSARLAENGIEADLQTYETFRSLQGLTTTSPGNTVVIYCTDHNQPADVLIQIFRKCVFLEEGNCVLIDDPSRPSGCEALVFDGKVCKKISSGGFSFIPSVAIE